VLLTTPKKYFYGVAYTGLQLVYYRKKT